MAEAGSELALHVPSGRPMAIVLAAGEGTRMRSARPKVLHEIGGLSMLGHVLRSVGGAGIDAVSVVVGPGRDDVAAVARGILPGADTVEQTERLGTAHAVLHARAMLRTASGPVVVLFGDTPLVTSSTIERMCAAVRAGAAVVALGFEADDPSGYGRLILEDGALVAIREHKDASEAERLIRFCNGGLMALDGAVAFDLLSAVGNDNAQKEYYLPDVVEIARARGLSATALEADARELMGVNDRVQLAAAEAEFQHRRRLEHMRAGVTLVAPETVFFSHDTQIGADVTIEPHVVFGPGVVIEREAVVHAFSHLAGVHVGQGASVGPFARLRPGTRLAKDAKIGNFVEVKASDVGEGAKISHLSYVGDSTVGAEANIGAGTITCNYDGFDKFRTVIGANAFIGSNSALVAPVIIGDGAFVASGSVIVEDVAPDALAIARGRQVEKPGWSTGFRAAHAGKARKRP